MVDYVSLKLRYIHSLYIQHLFQKLRNCPQTSTCKCIYRLARVLPLAKHLGK